MKRIKVGLLPLYIELYDKSGFNREPLEKFYSSIAEVLEKEGFDVIQTYVCRIKNEFLTSINKFEREGADAIVTLHLAYSPSLESVEALSATKLPLIVLDTTESYGFSKEYSDDPIMLNHGIHGVMDMCNLLKRCGKKYAVCAGHVNDGRVIKKVVDCVKAAVSANSLIGSKTGVFGTSFKGMGDFLVTKEEMKKAFDVEIINFYDEDMKNAFNNVSDTETEEEKSLYLKDFYILDDIDELKLDNSIKSCLAVRKVIRDKKLDAFTINFLNINKNNLKSMPFIECCKQMQSGIGYAGEGDALTASFVGAIGKSFDSFSFVEIFCPDWKNNGIFISHMGEMNYSVAKNRPVLTETAFPYTDAGYCFKGLAEFKSGEAIFCNVFKDNNEEFKLLLSEIKMVNNGTHDFDDSIRGWFIPPISLPQFLERLSEIGATHHAFIVYDVDIKAMEFFGSLLNMETVRI